MFEFGVIVCLHYSSVPPPLKKFQPGQVSMMQKGPSLTLNL